MRDMASNPDLEYFQRRAVQERERAARADDQAAKCIHLEMAERYSILSGTPRAVSSGATA